MLGCAPSPGDEGPARGTIELESCGARVADLRCGTLRVPERRGPLADGDGEEDQDDRSIDLKIVVAPSTSRTPAPDPVFLLAGGPGQGAADLAPMIAHKFDAIRRERDVVFVDLRGTGSSNPLPCEIEDSEDLGALLSSAFELERLDGCLESYAADLRHYTTPAMIDDLDEVRAGLGYEQVNLFGISYGTRAALVYMRRHPKRVRSAVLDGVVPLDDHISTTAPRNAEAALRSVLAECEADPHCDDAFPGLERKLQQVLTQLDDNRQLYTLTHPSTGVAERVEINRAGFTGALRAALYSGESAALLPLMIDRAHAGDFGPAATLLLKSSRHMRTVSMGLYLSVVCAEDLSRLEPGAEAEALAGLEVFDGHVFAKLRRACERWPHAELPASFSEPVASEVPTLLLSGSHDPVTPPALAERALAHLPKGRHLVVNAHHGIWRLGCSPELVAEFFANADAEALDASCYEDLERPPVFLSPAGPRTAAIEADEGQAPTPERQLAQGDP